MTFLYSKDLAAGLLFLGLGAGATFVGYGYDTGTVTQLGPGFLPMAAGFGIALLGATLIIRTILAGGGERLETVRILPVLSVILAAVSFGIAIEPLGLFVAIAIMTLLASFAGERRTVIQYLLLTAALCLVAYVIFVMGLAIPVKVWPV